MRLALRSEVKSIYKNRHQGRLRGTAPDQDVGADLRAEGMVRSEVAAENSGCQIQASFKGVGRVM